MPIVLDCTLVATEKNCYHFSGLASGPNYPFHRIAALLRILLNVKGHGWAARGDRGR
jgi:hypothetical protein